MSQNDNLAYDYELLYIKTATEQIGRHNLIMEMIDIQWNTI